MRLNQIRDLVEISEAGSMRAAARRLKVTPPALTRSVRELEDEIGIQLLERTAHGVIPTPAGRAFLARANVIQAEMGRIREETALYKHGTGLLKVGAPVSCHHLLPGALAAFRRLHPAIEVRLAGGTYLSLLPQLRDARLDFMVTGMPSKISGTYLKRIVLTRDEYVIIARRGHPLAAAKTLSALADADWMVYSGPEVPVTFPGAVHELFAHNGLPPPRSIVRCDGGGAYNALLIDMNLLSLCTRWRLSHGLGREALQALNVEMRKPPGFGFPVGVVYRADSPLTRPAADLLAAFKAEARKLLATTKVPEPARRSPGDDRRETVGRLSTVA